MPQGQPLLGSPRDMGNNRNFKFVSDAQRYNADILLICRSCRRRVIVERATFLAILDDRKINDWLEVAEQRMRCLSCYRRGATIELTPEGSTQAVKLREGDPLPPKGVSIVAWCLADAYERKRLVREARG